MGYTAWYEKSGPHYFYSNSDNQAERTFAYIIKHAVDKNNNGWDEAGAHQQAIWRWLWNNRNFGPFNGVPVSQNGADTSIYAEAEAQVKIPYSGTGSASIQTGNLEMTSDVGKLVITQLTGPVQEITITWENNTTSSSTRI